MIYCEAGSPETAFSADDLKKSMFTALKNLGSKQKVLVIPPDYTRLPSRSAEFGEDKQIDQQIRKHGYFGTPHKLKLVKENDGLRNNLAAATPLKTALNYWRTFA